MGHISLIIKHFLFLRAVLPPARTYTNSLTFSSLYTAYTSRLNGMNSFVKSKNWPASKWKF